MGVTIFFSDHGFEKMDYLPDMRFCRKWYMQMFIEEAYDIYKTGRTSRIVAHSTFGKLKPADVVTIDKIRNRQCCCDTCENVHTVIPAMKRHGFKGLGANSKKAIKDSMCECNKIKKTQGTHHMNGPECPKKVVLFAIASSAGQFMKRRGLSKKIHICVLRQRL